MRSQWRDPHGQSTWANEWLILALVVLIGGVVWGFWHGAGATWLQNLWSSVTSY